LVFIIFASESEGYTLTEEDKKTAVALYQKCPTLWDDFKNLTDIVDAFMERPLNFSSVSNKLQKLNVLQTGPEGEENVRSLCSFAVATGFVEYSTSFYRRMLAEMGTTYVNDFSSSILTNPRQQCLYFIRSHLLNFTCYSVEFSRRLVQAGFVRDMAEDLKHAQHLSGEALVSCQGVCLFVCLFVH
jgi:hypothetical protein